MSGKREKRKRKSFKEAKKDIQYEMEGLLMDSVNKLEAYKTFVDYKRDMEDFSYEKIMKGCDVSGGSPDENISVPNQKVFSE